MRSIKVNTGSSGPRTFYRLSKNQRTSLSSLTLLFVHETGKPIRKYIDEEAAYDLTLVVRIANDSNFTIPTRHPEHFSLGGNPTFPGAWESHSVDKSGKVARDHAFFALAWAFNNYCQWSGRLRDSSQGRNRIRLEATCKLVIRVNCCTLLR
jgi:hypothetical protein